MISVAAWVMVVVLFVYVCVEGGEGVFVWGGGGLFVCMCVRSCVYVCACVRLSVRACVMHDLQTSHYDLRSPMSLV